MSKDASQILDRMEPARQYEPQDLRAFAPDLSVERLREVMHELWINRLVERVGYSGWRRHPSAPSHPPQPVPREVDLVKPDELFDHTTFADFFKS